MTLACHIVCAGPCDDLRIDIHDGDFLIAVDGGFAHCMKAGLDPDLYIGDSDSIDEGLKGSISCERVDLDAKKDDTDTLAACKQGLERGYTRFQLHAALGGDVGHEFSNIQTLAFLKSQGANGALHGQGQSVHLVAPEDGLVDFHLPYGTRVSVLSFTDVAKGVTEAGMEWELADATMTKDMPYGTSNVAMDDPVSIGVSSGMLMVVTG